MRTKSLPMRRKPTITMTRKANYCCCCTSCCSAAQGCCKRSKLLKSIIQQIQKTRPERFLSKNGRRNSNNNNNYTEKSWSNKRGDAPSQYAMYSLVNTNYFTDKGNLTASVARGFLKLYLKLESNRLLSRALDAWEDDGEKFVVLDGINHEHLDYLSEELSFAATAIHSLIQKWGRSKLILVLSVLGREEDLAECLDGLDCLK